MPIAQYLAALTRNLGLGDATEHTHRPALKALVEAVEQDIHATNEPRRVACGAPDFNIYDHDALVGNIETKDVEYNLDLMERGRGPSGEQFRRYRDGLPNWILTDYLTFDWFVNGERRDHVILATVDERGIIREIPGSGAEVLDLIRAFVREPTLTINGAEQLATRLAGMTRNLRFHVIETFAHGSNADQAFLNEWLTTFRTLLLPGLKVEDFADMFSQTITYGLFAAKVYSPGAVQFTRQLAAFDLPRTNPFLRRLFGALSGVDLPATFDWAVDSIVNVLAHSDVAQIASEFTNAGRGNDPVVHFYETFLRVYNPELRERLGVYYTPQPVVEYLVSSVHEILVRDFQKANGLADEGTLILDPATGTGTFLFNIIAHIKELLADQAGAWNAYIGTHLLPRLFGFEFQVAPYIVAHLKLFLELRDDYDFAGDRRIGVYLTNTLDEAEHHSQTLLGSWISDESNAAASIKNDDPILVVIGNPPYSGHSSNPSRDENGDLTFIGNLIETYKENCPELYRPAQAKWLHDDYVKFIRFAQWRIDRSGEGIVAFITNHGYLENPTFRGMRRSLMESFDCIYILNLHGYSRRPQVGPTGAADQNVFDIERGVAIMLCVKRDGAGREREVYHADLIGSRQEKYDYLSQNSVSTTQWQRLTPEEPQFRFVPEDPALRAEFDGFVSLATLFSENGRPAPGIVTTHDKFAISFTRAEAEDKIRLLLQTATEDEARRLFRLCTTDQWNYQDAKDALATGEWRTHVIPIAYRPFDIRWTIYDRNVAVHRRERVMNHMLAGPNIALLTARANRSSTSDHFFCTNLISEAKTAESTIQSVLLPLYLYQRHDGLFEEAAPALNIPIEQMATLSETIGLEYLIHGRGDLHTTVGPEDVFEYTYGLLYSDAFRARFGAFMRTEFGRVPFSNNLNLFRDVAALGRQLVDLHLLRNGVAEDLITTYPVAGTDIVETVRYDVDTGRVWINDQQYIDGVSAAVWSFKIGGYDVIDKWLKARKMRRLLYDDIRYVQKVVVALNGTLQIMDELDDILRDWPFEPDVDLLAD